MAKKETIYNMEQLPMVLRIDDVAAVLNIGRSAAYWLVRSGQIKHIRIGTTYRIPRQEVMKFLGETA